PCRLHRPRHDPVMPYAFEPELAAVLPHLPVPGPASPTSGVADAVAAREGMSAFFASMGAAGPDVTGLVVEDRVVPGPLDSPGVPVRIYRPETRDGVVPGVLNIHGGGFYSGSIYEADTGAAALARELGVVVFDVE